MRQRLRLFVGSCLLGLLGICSLAHLAYAETLQWEAKYRSADSLRQEIVRLYPDALQSSIAREPILLLRLKDESLAEEIKASLEVLDQALASYELALRWGEGRPLSTPRSDGVRIATRDGLPTQHYSVEAGSKLLLAKSVESEPAVAWEGDDGERGYFRAPPDAERLALVVQPAGEEQLRLTLRYQGPRTLHGSDLGSSEAQLAGRETQVLLPFGRWVDLSPFLGVEESNTEYDGQRLELSGRRRLLEVRVTPTEGVR